MMQGYILDTNVLSEIYDVTHRNKNVERWIREQEFSALFMTTLNAAEILYGIENLPPSRRRTTLQSALDNFIVPQFQGRILSFDLKAAYAWGMIMAKGRKLGRQHPFMDSLLAAIALANNLGIATRNTKDFDGHDIRLVNPWI